MIADKGSKQQIKEFAAEIKAYHIAIFIGMGVIYFYIMLKIGLFVATFFYSAAMLSILNTNPFNNWKQIVIPGITLTLFVWIMFTHFIKIILR